MSRTDVVADVLVYLCFHRFVFAGIGTPDSSYHITEADGVLCPRQQVADSITSIEVGF